MLRFFLSILLLYSSHAHTQASCVSVVNNRPQTSARIAQADLLTFLRTNPAWGWSWFNKQKNNFGNDIQILSEFIGVVGGDVKPDNIDVIITGNKKQIGIIDYDDGGRGSLLGDLIHTLVYNHVWHTPITFEKALHSYQQGLTLNSKSTFSQFDLEDYRSRQKKYNKKLKKMSRDKSEFYESLKLIEPRELRGPNKELYQINKTSFDVTVKKLGNVIFEGIRIKDSGGSKGVLRVTYLIYTKNQKLKIIEFKHQTQAAVASAGTAQLTHAERLNEINKYYRPNGNWGSIITLLDTNGDTFIVREKVEPVFNGGEEAFNQTDIDNHEFIVTKMFQWLGYSHQTQNSDYATSWLKNSNSFNKQIKKMVDTQVNDAGLVAQ